jgi:hypothetical protein
VVLHRAEPEELRGQTAVGNTCGLHPGRELEPVDQLGEWCSVDVGDDRERAAVATVLAVEPDLIASFGGWTKAFTDPRLCAAIVDRLTFNGTIIETGTNSYRLATTRARAEEPAKAG